MKSGDGGTFVDQLLKDGVAIPLTGATILFLLKLTTDPFTTYSFSASITNAGEGRVEYVIVYPGFPTLAGTYDQEWEITFPGQAPITVPNQRYHTLIILPDLN